MARVRRAGVQVWDKFEEIDTSDDGRLDIDEFKHGCDVLGERMTEDEARFLLHPSAPHPALPPPEVHSRHLRPTEGAWPS